MSRFRCVTFAPVHFISIAFWLFLPTVLACHVALSGRVRAQNWVLWVASCVFYGWWDARFLLLIAGSTAVDYMVGLRLGKTDDARRRKAWLGLSLAFNLGALAWFKYAGFLADQWIAAWASVGVHMDPWTTRIVLPVGISFYTFQTLSYSVDVYRRKIPPCRDLLAFATYVMFFPQLVAGPIERASHLLPQLQRKRSVTGVAARIGWRLIFWGVFKKVVIADTVAMYANEAFGNPAWSGPLLIIGVVAFALQIYCDFSGYSDIAIGTARLFGIRLRSNFRFPYFSRDLGEFWRRWHISLNTWFRDYLYIPLGGSRHGKVRALRNVAVVFLVSGLWHGADWKFVTWGGVHALFFIPLFVMGRNRKEEGRWRWWHGFQALWTFGVVCFAWVFFRADGMAHALEMLGRMGSGWGPEGWNAATWADYSHFWSPCKEGPGGGMQLPCEETIFGWVLSLFLLLEWVQFRRGVRWIWRGIWSAPWVEALMVMAAWIYGTRHASQEFIYFAF